MSDSGRESGFGDFLKELIPGILFGAAAGGAIFGLKTQFAATAKAAGDSLPFKPEAFNMDHELTRCFQDLQVYRSYDPESYDQAGYAADSMLCLDRAIRMGTSPPRFEQIEVATMRVLQCRRHIERLIERAHLLLINQPTEAIKRSSPASQAKYQNEIQKGKNKIDDMKTIQARILKRLERHAQNVLMRVPSVVTPRDPEAAAAAESKKASGLGQGGPPKRPKGWRSSRNKQQQQQPKQKATSASTTAKPTTSPGAGVAAAGPAAVAAGASASSTLPAASGAGAGAGAAGAMDMASVASAGHFRQDAPLDSYSYAPSREADALLYDDDQDESYQEQPQDSFDDDDYA